MKRNSSKKIASDASAHGVEAPNCGEAAGCGRPSECAHARASLNGRTAYWGVGGR
jgi:hypothetical protein